METQQITITEEALGGSADLQVTLELPVEKVTVRELIRSRVYEAVMDRNVQLASQTEAPEQFERGQKEITLNGPKDNRPKASDWNEELEKACRAFQKKQILVLVDGTQIVDLDEELKITPQSDVRFLRIPLLMGG